MAPFNLSFNELSKNAVNSGVYRHGNRCQCVVEHMAQCVYGNESGHIVSTAEER